MLTASSSSFDNSNAWTVSSLISIENVHVDSLRSSADTDEEFELWVRHQLLPECNLKTTVLQAPHHGSDGSCSLPFLRAVDPEWIVVPAGRNLTFNHPREGSLRRLEAVIDNDERILRTDEGDATPEEASVTEDRGDDCYIFETDGASITALLRVEVD